LEKIARQVKTSVNKGELQGRNLIVTFQFIFFKFFSFSMVKSLKKGSERIFRDLLRATFSGLSKNVKVDKNLDLILCFVCGLYF